MRFCVQPKKQPHPSLRPMEPLAHACNPSYSGSRDQEDCFLKPEGANSLRDHISKKKNNRKTKPLLDGIIILVLIIRYNLENLREGDHVIFTHIFFLCFSEFQVSFFIISSL
jgi:hypothetical protein